MKKSDVCGLCNFYTLFTFYFNIFASIRLIKLEIVLVPPMLDECTKFLDERAERVNFTYEIIVVSDGSTDGTVKVANKYCEKLGTEKLRVLALETNRGKGGAVRLVRNVLKRF